MKKYLNALLVAVIGFNLRIALTSTMANTAIIKSDLALNNFQAGLLTSAPIICMGLFALLVYQIQKRFGLRMGVGIFTLWLALGSLFRFTTTSYMELLFSTLVVGSGIAIVSPLMSGFIKNNFPYSANVMVGVFTTSMGLGSVLASASSPWLIQQTGSWQGATGIWGVIALISAIIWFLLSPKDNKIAEAELNSDDELVEKVSMKALWSSPIVWQLILLYATQAGNNYAYTTWIQPYAVSFGHSENFGSVLVSLFTAVQTSASLTVPLLINRKRRLKLWTAICGLLMSLGALIMLFGAGVQALAIFSTILISYGGSGIFNISLIIPIRINDTAEEASVMTSVMQTVGYLVAALAPVLVGQIIDLTGDSNSLIYNSLIMGLITILLVKSRPVNLAD